MTTLKRLLFTINLIAVLIASCAINPLNETSSQENPTNKSNIVLKTNQAKSQTEEENQATSSPTIVYLPTVQKEFPLSTIFGVQMTRISSDIEIDQMKQLGITWTRQDLFWNQIERIEGQYDWSGLTSFEQNLMKKSANYINTILVINKTPEWARMYSNSECGPVKREKFDSFGKFLSNVVNRYSKPPYNVLYYEIWNEPDIDPALFGYSGNSIGCWGDDNDDYYGGGYYADMLRVIYPYIKSANPNAKILVGGLLLDCDPRGAPSPCHIVGNNPKPAKFLEGILRNNGKDLFDGVSFHAYDQYNGELGKYGIRNWNSSWDTTGPTVLAKTKFLQEILGKYNASDKILINTESAVLCDSCTNDPNYELTKAFYIAQVYSTAISLGLQGNLWYSSTGWRNSGLIKSDGTPIQPAFQAYQHARETLLNSRFVRELSLGENIKGFEFTRNGTSLWVIWSINGNPNTIVLPKQPSKITSSIGDSLPTSQSIQITIEPLYIEFAN
jgi:hypothetical protein